MSDDHMRKVIPQRYINFLENEYRQYKQEAVDAKYIETFLNKILNKLTETDKFLILANQEIKKRIEENNILKEQSDSSNLAKAIEILRDSGYKVEFKFHE